jgi:hypothetical protein
MVVYYKWVNLAQEKINYIDILLVYFVYQVDNTSFASVYHCFFCFFFLFALSRISTNSFSISFLARTTASNSSIRA